MIVLEEEVEFGIVEARSKINKRKNDKSGEPSKKRKIFENIVNWGDDEETNDVETNDLVNWLVRVEDNANTSKELKDNIVGPIKEPSRMKQLELSFVKKVTEEWPNLNPIQEPEGRKEQKQKKKQKLEKVS